MCLGLANVTDVMWFYHLHYVCTDMKIAAFQLIYEASSVNARTSLCLLLFWLITYQPQPIVTIFIMSGVDAGSFHTVQNCLDLL